MEVKGNTRIDQSSLFLFLQVSPECSGIKCNSFCYIIFNLRKMYTNYNGLLLY